MHRGTSEGFGYADRPARCKAGASEKPLILAARRRPDPPPPASRTPAHAGYTARVNPRPPPLVPNATSLVEALRQSAPLALLRQRLSESNARLAVVRALLPSTLAAHTTAGSFDEEGWTLLAANPPIAAKLRQLRPRLEEALAGARLPVVSLRIRVRHDDQP